MDWFLHYDSVISWKLSIDSITYCYSIAVVLSQCWCCNACRIYSSRDDGKSHPWRFSALDFFTKYFLSDQSILSIQMAHRQLPSSMKCSSASSYHLIPWMAHIHELIRTIISLSTRYPLDDHAVCFRSSPVACNLQSHRMLFFLCYYAIQHSNQSHIAWRFRYHRLGDSQADGKIKQNKCFCFAASFDLRKN